MTTEAPKLTAAQVRRSIDRFIDYGNSLADSTDATFTHSLRRFINFLDKDEVFDQILSEFNILNRDFDMNAWWNKVKDEDSLDLPVGDEFILYALRLLIFIHNHTNPDLFAIDISSRFNFTTSARYEDNIREFNRVITKPLVQELRYKLEDTRDALPENPKEVLQPQLLQIFNAHIVTAQNAIGDGNVQTAKIESSSLLEPEFSKLEQLIKEHLPSDVHEENLDLVETAKDLALANKPSKAKSVLNALKNSIRAIPTIAKGVQDFTASVVAIESSVEKIAPWIKPITSQIEHIIDKIPSIPS